MRTCSPTRRLREIKDITPDTARKVRRVWLTYTRQQLCKDFICCAEFVRDCHHPPETRILRRMAVDALLQTFGVEYLGESRKTRQGVYYCNTGDTYGHTVLFFGPHLRTGNWGDLIERRSIRECQQW